MLTLFTHSLTHLVIKGEGRPTAAHLLDTDPIAAAPRTEALQRLRSRIAAAAPRRGSTDAAAEGTRGGDACQGGMALACADGTVDVQRMQAWLLEDTESSSTLLGQTLGPDATLDLGSTSSTLDFGQGLGTQGLGTGALRTRPTTTPPCYSPLTTRATRSLRYSAPSRRRHAPYRAAAHCRGEPQGHGHAG